MNIYTKHYWKLKKYKQNFENMLDVLQAEKNFENKKHLANYAANYFVYHNTGYYTSSVLENFYVEYAHKIKTDLSEIKYNKNSTLHILSEGYEAGGHTRVVERWVENAPAEQNHSVILTRPNDAKLETLKNNVNKKNGTFLAFDNNWSLEEKAIKLRRMAMQYEYIILHTHMEDVIPILAFGTEEFTRPVLLYNHANHMPWIGKSIADLVLDIIIDSPVTTEKRGITNTYFLGVPSKKISLSISDKNEVRKKLNLPIDKKIIVSSGRNFRYRKIAGKSYIDYLKEIMDDDTYCYVIGIKHDKEWSKAAQDTKNHIITIEFIDFNKGFLDYLKAADLYLDSYPLPSGTAVIDAISSGTPVISLKSVCPQFDYLTTTSAYCKSGEEFVNKARKVINDEKYADELFEELKNSLIKNQSKEAWNEKVKNLYDIAPKQHKVQHLSNIKDYSEPNDLSVLCNVIQDANFIKKKFFKHLSKKDITDIVNYPGLYKSFGIPYIFQILSVKKNNKKEKIIKLFNIKIFSYQK